MGAVAKERDRGGCGSCCNAVNGRMAVVDVHQGCVPQSMPQQKEHATSLHVRLHPRHRARARLEVRVRAQRHDAAPWGLVSLGRCAPRMRRARRRAGCVERALGGARGHCGGARRAMCCAAVLPGFARSPRAERLWANSWGSATQHGAGCGVQVCGGVWSRGRWSQARWCSARCGCRLRCSSVGNVWWWGVAIAVGSAPERGDGGERVPL